MLQVLAVDDGRRAAGAPASVLGDPGVALTTCAETAAARALLTLGEYQALVCDLAASDLGGLEGLRLVEFAHTHFPAMAVLGTAHRVDDALRARGAQLGARAVYAVPDELAALRAAVGALATTPAATPATHRHVGRLDAYLAGAAVTAQLQPIVRAGPAPPFEVAAVESLVRGPAGEPLANPSLLFAYAAAKERLFDVDLRCIEAGLAAAEGLPHGVLLFLNVNPRSLSNPQFTPRLLAALATARRSPASVILELTEQQGILNTGAFAERLAELRFEGVRAALDDFGEGNSNLEVLRNLRPAYVKISGKFCSGVVDDVTTREIVGAQATLIRRLGLHSVMEFVENATELAQLCTLGIDLVQGWHIARSASLDALQADATLRFPTPA